MSRFTLYTYENRGEFDKIYKEFEDEGNKIYNFYFEQTEELLRISSTVNLEPFAIDISALVENIQYNPANKQPALYNLKELEDTCKVMIKSQLADLAMEYFYLLFDEVEPLYAKTEHQSMENTLIPFNRKVLYTYRDGLQLDNIIDFVDENKIPFTNFSKLSGTENKNFRLLCNNEKRAIVDITTVVKAVSNSPQIIYLVEQMLESFQYYDAVVREDVVNEALDSYRLLFSSQKPVSELLQGIILNSDDKEAKHEERVNRVVDLTTTQLKDFFDGLSLQLIGHNEFKKRFQSSIENFITLNRIDEKKIFSVLLLGNSGLGKTEVARIVKNSLNNDTSFVKVNFGNYSSNDALNSLIGSPKGYIGCDDGELGVKINKSKAGIILCDEFEKATRPVFDFFLELLEDGIFTDSMSREYNLDGYIIIFTSNINPKQFYDHIPQELQSRFDLVCEFQSLTKKEKTDYLEYQLKTFMDKLKTDKNISEFSYEDVKYFKKVDIDNNDNLRDIKRMLRERVLNRIKR